MMDLNKEYAAILITGARQVGKSTLLDSFEEAKRVEADVMAGALPLNLDLVNYEIMEAEE